MDVMEFLTDVSDFRQFLNNLQQGFIPCTNSYCQNLPSEEDYCDKCEIVGFQSLCNKTISVIGLLISDRKRRQRDANDFSAEQNNRELYYAIIDNLLSHLESRFSSLHELAFFYLLSPTKYKTVFNKRNFPAFLLTALENNYPNMFNIPRLKTELIIFYKNNIFEGKSPQHLVKLLGNEQLDTPFLEIFRLATLITTIPATAASVERCSSALEKIHTYKRSTRNDNPLDGISILSIERKLLESIMQKDDFYNIVTEKFVGKTQRPEFFYK